MSTRHPIVISIASLMAVTGAIIWAWPSNEPVYEGHRLSAYLYRWPEYCERPGQLNMGRDFVADAFEHFGTNALPYLRSALRVKDTFARRALVWLASKQSLVQIRARSASEVHCYALEAYKVYLNLVYDGEVQASRAAACSSEIQDLLQDPDPIVRALAGEVIDQIGRAKFHTKSRGNSI